KRTAGKTSGGFSSEERAAMKERAQEMKASARAADGESEGLGKVGGGRGRDEESEVLAKIAEMREPDRAMAERLHALVKANAPVLVPRLWYGMPAYANDAGVVCFFQTAQKFKTRYATLGVSD